MLLPLLVVLGHPAHAADVTALPTPMRGLAMLDYDASGSVMRLLEGDTQVGASQQRQHELTLHGAFSPYQGIALSLDLPVVLDQRLVYSVAHQMVFDPTQGSGSMSGADSLDPPPILHGGGLAGPLLALQLTPFNHTLFPNRVDRTTWLLEAGYRFQDKSSWWQQKADGTRGGGPGGDAIHFKTAFSTTAATSRPYVAMSFDKAFAVPTQLRDTDATVLDSDAAVRPASRLQFKAGTELPVKRTPQLEFAVDLRLGFGYRSWQDIPSGIYLPDVLAASRGILVTQGEALHAKGGLGLQLHILDKADVLLGGDAGIESPYRIEHPYPISTGLGTVVWDAQFAVRVWIDDPLLGISD